LIEPSVKSQATGELKTGGGSIGAGGVTIRVCFPTGSTGKVGESVRVTVSAPYNWLGYLVGKGFPANTTLSATATARIEQAYDGSGTNAYTPASCTT
jgi:hypothetical protein